MGIDFWGKIFPKEVGGWGGFVEIWKNKTDHVCRFVYFARSQMLAALIKCQNEMFALSMQEV
jgi:hypothetical protein